MIDSTLGGARIEAEIARQAALRYVDDRAPGIRRKRRRGGFAYFDADGKALKDERALQRIRALAIPPAYEDVWICPSAAGHLQATGRDARGRKQYRYHKRWREVRDEAKFQRSIAFARALPALRKRIETDLQTNGLTRDKVLATVAKLLDTTLARVGNESYARENDSYGLTTLRAKHVRVEKGALRLRFRGKSGVEHSIRVSDRRLAATIRRCKDLPGQELFTYIDDAGNPVPICSDDVNAYLREVMGEEFTAKDFRTWHGTVMCATELELAEASTSEAERRKIVAAAVGAVATRLRNTAAVCRSSYVHPAVIERFMTKGALKLPRLRKRPSDGFSEDEARVLRLLEGEAKRARHNGPGADDRT